jgi:small-conductance mechanosensitive channel
MCNALKSVIYVVFALLAANAGYLSAAPMADSLAPATTPAPVSMSDSELLGLQNQLNSLKQQVSLATNYTQLESSQDQVQALIQEIDLQSAALLPGQSQLQAQLTVLGPVPHDENALVTSAIATQRDVLSEQKSKIDEQLKTLAALKVSAAELITQIASIRRSLLESEVTQQTNSILNPSFWSPLFDLPADDRQRFSALIQQLEATHQAAWQPGQRWITATLLLLALVIWTVGRKLAGRLLAWVCIHRMPEGRLRRSSLALASVLATLLSAGIALQLLHFAGTRQLPYTPLLADLAQYLEKLAYTCVLITGLSRALLSTKHPSWRLPDIADEVALAMEPYPRLLASLLLVLVTLVQMSNVTGMSAEVVLFGRGIVALVAALVIGALLLRVSKTRRALIVAGEAPEGVTTSAGLIYAFSGAAVVVSLFALVIGYVTMARFITYEMVWVFIIFSGFYLLTQVYQDTCDYLFSPRQPAGKAIKQLLGIGNPRLEQICTVLSGSGRAILMLIGVIALFVGGVGTTLGQLVTGTVAILGGEGLRKLNIVPDNLLRAFLTLMIGVYLIRTLRRWLDREFLPKTEMDPGMCASLSTLFANIGYASVVLLTLSSLGIQWTNLAWIVSALSVGIGFGLQEIVKNFISGLILLTERPVKVGDLISISGVEGDIRRINVRATEIQLADRSIMIVPNSHLISQNLRNVTLGGSAQGVVILELMFPLDIDPELVQNLLMDSYTEHESILDKPAPFLRFSQLKPEGITLTITGYVGSPRLVGAIKSELLFEILKRLGAAGIELTKPPTA